MGVNKCSQLKKFGGPMPLWEPVFFFLFAWEATWVKILTIEILMRRGWTMEIDVASAKTMKEQCHILIHCDRIKMLWNLILSISCWNGCFQAQGKTFSLDGRPRKFWCMVPLCLFWYIWKEPNWRIFCEEGMPNQRLRETLRVAKWCICSWIAILSRIWMGPWTFMC